MANLEIGAGDPNNLENGVVETERKFSGNEVVLMPETLNGCKASQEAEVFQPRRVVVTGMGMICPLGIGVESSWYRLINGESGFSSVSFDQIEASVAGQVKDFDPLQALTGLINAKDLRRMSRPALFALAASLEALRHAGLLDTDLHVDSRINRDRFGVQIGTGIGGATGIIDTQRRLDSGRPTLPTDVLRVIPERVSTIPSMIFELRGPNETPAAACATGNVAITGGYKEIALNQADIMLVGGTEASLDQACMSLFDYAALDKEPDPAKASRPFDTKRDGFVFSEGSGVLVIESEDHALARGANILAYIGGYGNTADAHNDTAPSGEGAQRALRLALQSTEELPRFPRTYINAHGTATLAGDPVEMKAIRDVIPPDATFAVSSTKGAIGHTLGAAGAIETIFCVKALETNTIPPTVHNEQPIKEAKGINIVPNDAQHMEIDAAVNNSFGFGGINSVIILYRRPV